MANTNSLNLNSGGTSNAQYVHAADSASLSVTSDLTLECWVYLGTLASALTANQTFINKDVNDGNISFRLFQDTSTDKVSIRISSSGTTGAGLTTGTSNTTLGTGIWIHIAAAYYAAGGSVLFYKDGLIDGTMTSTVTSVYDGTAALQIGATGGLGAPAQYAMMLVDEVRLWAETRSAANILANYRQELAGNETNLNAYYKLNNAYTDATANANNLTAVNAPTFSANVPFGGGRSGLQSKIW